MEKTEVNKLKRDCRDGLVRKLMSKDEITLANKMVKEGVLYKGTTPDKYQSVVYFLVNQNDAY